jgi:spermidine synthase
MDRCLGPTQGKARVLLVGGGDGWIAGHLVHCYSDYVESVTAVELDKMVSDVTEKYFRDVMRDGSPFKHPRITWEYTDAYAWAVERTARCSSSSSSDAASDAAVSSSSNTSARSENLAAAAAAATAPSGRRLQAGSAGNMADTVHAMRASSSSSGSSSRGGQGSKSALDCTGFDVVIIDSTDFTVAAASKLHSAPFYAALHELMKPQAALIQIVEIYMRIFEKDFKAMEAALRGSGWSGVGRSGVFVPSYGGEAVMLHAVKQ